MADSESSLAQTILYLRPQTHQAIAVLDLEAEANEPYIEAVAPPPEPSDIPLEGISPIIRLSHDITPYGHERASRESTPGLFPFSLRVFRLGFDSIEKPSVRGFEFGPNSDIKLPYDGKSKHRAYFRIHYNFNSGALLITALDKIRVGAAILGKDTSLLLMAGTIIKCGNDLEFIVEFPDLSNCAEEHEQNYRQYAAKFGIHGAPYMATSSDGLPIGAEHRSKAIIGNGSFGEVHKAVNTKNGEAFAIKILSGKESEMNEVNILSKLCHVSQFVLFLSRILMLGRKISSNMSTPSNSATARFAS